MRYALISGLIILVNKETVDEKEFINIFGYYIHANSLQAINSRADIHAYNHPYKYPMTNNYIHT